MRFVLHTIGVFAQAFKGNLAPVARTVAAAAAVAALAGCSMTGKGLDETAVGAIAIVNETAPVAGNPFTASNDAVGSERDRLLDEDTIRNAVTSADLSGRPDEALSWANPSTGSNGLISGIEQRKIAGQLCRRFEATREAYDGVTLYEGDLCLDRRTGWWTRVLAPAQAGGDA